MRQVAEVSGDSGVLLRGTEQQVRGIGRCEPDCRNFRGVGLTAGGRKGDLHSMTERAAQDMCVRRRQIRLGTGVGLVVPQLQSSAWRPETVKHPSIQSPQPNAPGCGVPLADPRCWEFADLQREWVTAPTAHSDI